VHGGVSIQECLIPDIRVQRSAEMGSAATVKSLTWIRLRCYAVIEAHGSPVTADLRLHKAFGKSVAARAKEIDADGSASLVMIDDEHEDDDLVFVVLDARQCILAQRLPVRGILRECLSTGLSP